MKLPTLTFRMFVACVGLVFTAATADAQTIYTWNNTGTSLSAASSWNPTNGPPTSSDILQFTPGGSPFPTIITQPTIDANQSTGTIILAPTPSLNGWTFSGGNTLSVGGLGIVADGPATYTFDGPAVQGLGAVNQLFTVTNGSTVVLQGNSTAPGNTGTTMLHGGTLVLDNSINNASNRFPSTSAFNFLSGTLELRGNTSAATHFDLGPATINGGNFAGVNTIRLVPGGGEQLSAAFNIAGPDFTTLFSSSSVFRFETTSGVLGGPGANDPKVTFTGSPAVGANGLLASAAGGPSVGFAIVSDANGTDFATWTAADGIKAAGATLTSGTVAGISAGTALSRVFYTPGSGSQTASADITNGSLRITPSATGGTLAMGTHNLQTVALMLNGNRDFTISGTGTLGSGIGPRYIHVNDPNTTLTTSLVIASGTVATPTDIVGPGFVALSGTVSQNTSSGPTRLLGGTLRANATQLGFTSSGSGNLTFAGGVLEIQNGSTFSRPLGATAGMVQWTGGNGGFSAFGSNATVNLGGSGATVTWNSGGFVGNGYALTFGSTKSNATVTWQNAIDLGAPANGSYALREVKVTSGAGTLSDLTVLAGPITGAPNADLIKTGNGVLELDSLNTYQGNTLIQGGTLVVNGSLGAVGATKTGNVVVGAGARLGGTGTVSPDQSIPLDPKSVIVNPGGTIRGGTPVTSVGSDHVGTLTINSGVTINSSPTANGTLQFEASKTGPGTASASQIVLDAGYNLNLNPGAGNKFTINLMTTSVTTPLDLGQQYTLTLASVGTDGHIQLNGTSLADGTVIDQSNYVLNSSSFSFDPGYTLQVLGSDATGYNLTLSFQLAPVPEPAFALAFAAASLVLGARIRRAGGRREPAAHC